jgi:hypothetical protein
MTLLTKTNLTSNLSDRERIAHIKADYWIPYKRAKEVLQTLEDLMDHPKTTRMPALLLCARTSNGKSHLLQKFFDAYKPVVTPETEKLTIPVVYVQAPPKPVEKAFFVNILEALNAPYRVSSNEIALRYQVFKILRAVGTRVLIIDEIHHILAGAYLNQRAFLNEIKGLANDLQIVIVGAGIRDALSAINTDRQISNRFEPAILPTWKLDGDYFRLLSSFEAMLPLHESSNLTKEDIAIKILGMSGGTIGEISTIIKKAAIMAIHTGKEHIDIPILNNISYVGPDNRQKQYEQMAI